MSTFRGKKRTGSKIIDQEEIIRIVAQEYGLMLDKNDPILTFLAVHDALSEAHRKELAADIRRITGDYQERTKGMAETIVGDAVQKIAAEGYSLQNEMRRLRQPQQADTRRLAGTIKLASGVVSAVLIIAAITIALV